MIWYFYTAPFLKPVGVCHPHRAHHLSTWLWGPGGLSFLSPVDLKQSERQATTPKVLHRYVTQRPPDFL